MSSAAAPMTLCHGQPAVSPIEDGWLLVVEDDPDLRGLVALTLSELTNMEVKAARDGVDAAEYLRQGRPALVVTDLMMPRMDGYELFDHIRDDYADLPVVAMSAAESRNRADAAGFDAYLVKPFELEELAGLLQRLLAPGER